MEETPGKTDNRLFADASNGIQQFVGGTTVPVSVYDFKCGPIGIVSTQLGSPPFPASLRGGNQEPVVRFGGYGNCGVGRILRV